MLLQHVQSLQRACLEQGRARKAAVGGSVALGRGRGGGRDMGAYYDDYDPDRAYLGAIAEPGAWYDNYVNDYADEEDDHEDDYDFGGA